jgi:uncharacterized protein
MKLRIGKDGFALPLEFVVEASAILAVRGAGKSYLAMNIAEETLDAGQQLVVLDPKGDWWGLKSSADGEQPGYPVIIFGGEHADVPLEEPSGSLLADVIVDSDIDVILDLSDLSKAGARRFVADFLERLYWRKRTRAKQTPLLVVMDEADAFVPQRIVKGGERCFGAADTLVRRGRGRGLGTLLITQRPAVIAKDVLTQVSVLVAMRMGGPQDITAIDAWVQAHGDIQQAAEMKASLPSLPTGTAWVWAPHLLGGLSRVEIRESRTFDSTATPSPGHLRREPKRLADVDLKALGEKIAATVERAKAEDPRELRAQIVKLRRELAAAQKAAPEPVERIVEVEIERVTPAAEDVLKRAASVLRSLVETATSGHDLVSGYVGEIEQLLAEEPARTTHRVERPAPANPVIRAPVQRVAPVATEPLANGDVQLKAGARRILETLARHHPMRVTRAQLGTLARFKITGGTFLTYWSLLRRVGFVDESGGDIGITEAGLDYVGVVPGEPATTEELLAQWRSALKAGARAILDQLVAAYPNGIEKEDLAQRVEMTATGGTFLTYVSTLRRNGLAVVNGSTVTASEALFMKEGR